MWRNPDRRGMLGAIGAAAVFASSAHARERRPMRVMLLGQSLIQRDVCREGWPGMKAIAALLRRADVVFTDLETPIDGPEAGDPTRADATLHRAPPEALDCLRALGVTLVTTANNHAWDLGTGGILSTIDALDRRGIVHAGSGRDLAAAAAPAIQHTPAGGFALVAAAAGAIRPGAAAAPGHAGVNELRRRGDGTLEPADVERVLAAICAARAAGATVLMCLHNHYWEPVQSDTPAWQKSFARACVDAGAAAFVGHGTPVMQARESWRGAPLFHGLGNFIFQTRKADGAYGAEAWRSTIVEARFADGRFIDARFHPIRLEAAKRGELSWGVPTLARH
ncbi:capsule biosynthesis protein CapA [Sphingomonas sp. CL5.1]|uniref:CapA family protein n=1 Tax=Sphingomonas sp. CL5.1 TaxID=2653203 RepID=UPI00158335F8|nr:CapA family protein [Sphingomonas sp. CL5.1]QKR99491.1 capsule biosynthesis protein CapA [Sphingomonas sp. CL5.1]